MILEEEIEPSLPYTERSPLWLSGFLVLGVLIGLLGSLVVAWHYHIDVEPQIIGLHFLALSVGYVLAATIGNIWARWMPRLVASASVVASWVSAWATSWSESIPVLLRASVSFKES